MKTVIVSSKDLGMECWAANRLLGECQVCAKFRTCKVKSKSIKPEVQSVLSRIDELKAIKKSAEDEINELQEKHNISPPSQRQSG